MWFTKTHEWVEIEGDLAMVGVTNFAQKELGDIVYVELPEVGKHVKAGDDSAVLESTKAAADVYAPISGQIKEINASLKEAPEKVNLSAENEGWLYKMTIANPDEFKNLMDSGAYTAGKTVNT